MGDFLLFTVEERRFAVDLTTVRRVVRMVDVTPLADPPETIAGIINVHGEAVPVIALRKISGLPPRPPLPSDHLIIVAARERIAALPVDTVEEVSSIPAENLLPLDRLLPEGRQEGGIATVADGIVLVCDVARFLSPVVTARGGGADDAAL